MNYDEIQFLKWRKKQIKRVRKLLKRGEYYQIDREGDISFIWIKSGGGSYLYECSVAYYNHRTKEEIINWLEV